MTSDYIKFKINTIWICCIVVCVVLICATCIVCANSTYTLNFIMDNNTLQAFQSIDYNAILNG